MDKKYPTQDEFDQAMAIAEPNKLFDNQEAAWNDISDRIKKGHSLSQKQINYWWFLRDMRSNSARKTNQSVNTYKNLLSFLSKAAQKIQRPSLSINGLLIRKNSPMYSRYPDDYVVKKGDRYLGSLVSASASFLPAKHLSDNEKNKLRLELGEIDRDPMAAILSDASCNCVFCGRELDNEHSRKAHYGPTCAENYGLPWGD